MEKVAIKRKTNLKSDTIVVDYSVPGYGRVLIWKDGESGKYYSTDTANEDWSDKSEYYDEGIDALNNRLSIVKRGLELKLALITKGLERIAEIRKEYNIPQIKSEGGQK